MFQEIATALYFTSVEARLPVNDYTFKGVHIWPLIRSELHSKLINRILKEAPPEVFERIAAFGQAVLQETKLPHPDIRFDVGGPPVPAKPDGPRPALTPALFFTRFDEHYRVTPAGRYAPILDPWYETALELGPALKFEFLSDAFARFQPRRHPALGLSAPDGTMMQAAHADVLRDGSKSILELLNRLVAFTLHNFGLDLRPEVNALASAFIVCLAHKEMVDRVITAVRPRTLFHTCFYHLIGQAVLWSCHDHGVRTIEIQHSVNGENQPPYTHWTAVPPEGYAMLPDVFLTWGDISANNVQRWLPRNGNPHRVVVGGRPDLMKTRAEDPAIEQVAALCRNHRRVILVSMDYEPLEPALVEAMKRAPQDWLWLMRSHPWAANTGMKDACPNDVHDFLAREGITNFETHLSTQVFLSTVLTHCNHHVTRISSVALEALCFNVPSTFIFPTARDLYATFINARRAGYADTADGIIESIENGWSGLAADGPSDIVTDLALPRSVLENLLWDEAPARSR